MAEEGREKLPSPIPRRRYRPDGLLQWEDLIESGDSGSVVLLKELNDDGVGATAVGLAFVSSRASSVPCMTPMIHGLAEFRAIQRQGIFN
jgi:hypothetical protein